MWKCHAEQAGGSLLYASSKRADVDGRGRNPRVEKYSATRCVARSLFNYSNPKKIRQKSVRYYFTMILLSCDFFWGCYKVKRTFEETGNSSTPDLARTIFCSDADLGFSIRGEFFPGPLWNLGEWLFFSMLMDDGFLSRYKIDLLKRYFKDCSSLRSHPEALEALDWDDWVPRNGMVGPWSAAIFKLTK